MLGPGSLESAYEECLCHELLALGIPFERQVILPLMYKGRQIGQGYRIDLLVADAVVVEVKAVEALLPVHGTQLLTYLRLGGWTIGLLMNFHGPTLVGGLRRIANDYRDP